MPETFLLRLFSRLSARPRLRPYPGWQLGSRGKGATRWLYPLRKELWRRMPAPVLISWLDGLRVYAYPGDEACRSLFVTGYYEPNEFCVLDKILRPGMTFVDVGANMGLYTLFPAGRVGPQGTVLAIEPSRREFERLQRNVEANALANVRLVQTAASDRRGEADLLIAGGGRSGHNTLGGFGYETPLQGKERVQLQPLDEIVEREGLGRLDILKMDIEGAEHAALRGATETLRRFRPMILMELSDRSLQQQGSSGAEVWEFLSHSGYAMYAFDPRTGLPAPAERKRCWDSEIVLAVHRLASPVRW